MSSGGSVSQLDVVMMCHQETQWKHAERNTNNNNIIRITIRLTMEGTSERAMWKMRWAERRGYSGNIVVTEMVFPVRGKFSYCHCNSEPTTATDITTTITTTTITTTVANRSAFFLLGLRFADCLLQPPIMMPLVRIWQIRPIVIVWFADTDVSMYVCSSDTNLVNPYPAGYQV